MHTPDPSERITTFLSVLDFIDQHTQADVRQLLLKKHPYPPEAIREAALQIQARRKAKDKLPGWFAHDRLCYPSLLALEQCSSEQTAHYKASLLQGSRLIDLTGGMGVDTAAFAARFQEVIYIEQNPDLQPITAYNLAQLGITNVTCVPAHSLKWLQTFPSQSDWLYIDPARRDESGSKVFRLADCEPDVLTFKELLFQKTDNILLKASPMLDIEQGISDLQTVKRVYVVAVDNEVKELLFHWTPAASTDPEIVCVHLSPSAPPDPFCFFRKQESQRMASFSDPLTYLYEPNAAILKAGAFKSIAQAFSLCKLHPHSHLYTSHAWHPHFPGRAFRVKGVSKVDKKSLRPWLPDHKAHITIRNFPGTVAQLRKQTGIHEGGDTYLFATTLQNNQKVMLVCAKGI